MKICKSCGISKDMHLNFRYRLSPSNSNPKYIFCIEHCNDCLDINRKTKLYSIKQLNFEFPDWAVQLGYDKTYKYARFLEVCSTHPILKCGVCKLELNRYYDFYVSFRKQAYKSIPRCKKCSYVKNKWSRNNCKKKYLSNRRKRWTKLSEDLDPQYVRKVILDKKRCKIYKENPSLLPTVEEYTLTLAKKRLEKQIKILSNGEYTNINNSTIHNK